MKTIKSVTQAEAETNHLASYIGKIGGQHVKTEKQATAWARRQQANHPTDEQWVVWPQCNMAGEFIGWGAAVI